jgi:hypothetical protein
MITHTPTPMHSKPCKKSFAISFREPSEGIGVLVMVIAVDIAIHPIPYAMASAPRGTSRAAMLAAPLAISSAPNMNPVKPTSSFVTDANFFVTTIPPTSSIAATAVNMFAAHPGLNAAEIAEHVAGARNNGMAYRDRPALGLRPLIHAAAASTPARQGQFEVTPGEAPNVRY